ncbi:aminoglycoside adenylyltransferase domain-containing protein [Peribacillus sp. SCS-37]|uniref:aminoglycoside adenylyltransferase domain-containing protein n=1 Tax=Paraperibacillus esterisolvens TaxID=3115296 RepID=UPI00390623BD
MVHIPIPARQVIEEFTELMERRLPLVLNGLYLHGSIALGAFGPGSDIDFLALTSRSLDSGEVEVLRGIHRILAENHDCELDGSYILQRDISGIPKEGQTFTYQSGALVPGHAYNPVTKLILNSNGITITGIPWKDLEVHLDPGETAAYVMDNMNSYWGPRVMDMKKHFEDIGQLPLAVINEEIDWSVLGVLRQFYTLKENKIISKIGAGEYGLNSLPVEWHPIIRSAIEIRRGLPGSLNRPARDEIDQAIQFLHYLIDYCNTAFKFARESK